MHTRRNFLRFCGTTGLAAHFSTLLGALQPSPRDAQPQLPRVAELPCFIVEKVREAQQVLASASHKFNAGTVKTPRRALLAVMDTQTCAIETVPILYRRQKFGNTSRYDITARVPGWTIRGLSGTGMATAYEVVTPTNKVVLATLYPSFTARSVERIVYSAPSPGVHTPEMVEEGLSYLDRIISAAIDELGSAGVAWKFRTSNMTLLELDASQTPWNGFLRTLIKNLVAIEHIDEAEFFAYRDDPAVLFERVLVILGANKERAFNWSGSDVGAYGIAQFMAGTYKEMLDTYPEAHLMHAPIKVVKVKKKRRVVRGLPEFHAAMRNHVNAVKAMVCLIDRDLAWLARDSRVAIYLAASPATGEEALMDEGGFRDVLACRLWLLAPAAYNAGAGRIPDIIAARGWQWFQATTSNTTCRRLRERKSFLEARLRRKKLADRKKTIGELAVVRRQIGQSCAALPAQTITYSEKSIFAHEYFAQ